MITNEQSNEFFEYIEQCLDTLKQQNEGNSVTIDVFGDIPDHTLFLGRLWWACEAYINKPFFVDAGPLLDL